MSVNRSRPTVFLPVLAWPKFAKRDRCRQYTLYGGKLN
jgi:hypothetical protein